MDPPKESNSQQQDPLFEKFEEVAALEAALEEASASSSQAVEAVDPVWDRFEAFAAEEERKDKEEKDRQGAASLALALLAAGCIVLLRKVTTC